VRLPQIPEESLEARGVELRPRGPRRVVRCRALCHELLASILEVLSQLLDDFAFTHRRQAQRYKSRADV
jgi:hypothetical protein